MKINSSDFRRGGLTKKESLIVIQKLQKYLHFVEISGGNYENPEFIYESGKVTFYDYCKEVTLVKIQIKSVALFIISSSAELTSLNSENFKILRISYSYFLQKFSF